MSCSWCTNRSFIIVMSLVNSPIARILFVLGTQQHACSFAAPTCPIANTSANNEIARLFLPAVKTSEWNIGRSPEMERLDDRCVIGMTRICCVTTYVGRVTAAPTGGGVPGLVKDCTTPRFCLMGHRMWSDCPPLVIDRAEQPSTFYPPSRHANAPT